MSQGQRFRRRALRRGYKVDEVDSFLDRVEATIAGDSMGQPVSAQEVHDVVFRVRFGGYDEWQVDLHLDRVERQLSELEERTGFPRGGMEPRPEMRSGEMRSGEMRPGEMRSGEMRMAPPERMAPPDRMMPERIPPDRVGPDRIAPDRMPVGGMPLDRMPPDRMPLDRMPPDRMPPDRMPPDRMPPDRMPPDRMPAPDRMSAPPMDPRMAPPPPMAPPLPTRPNPMPAQAGPPSGGPGGPGYNNRYDEPTYGGAFDDNGGYEPSRHVRGDMTTEIRMDRGDLDRGMGGPDRGGMDRGGMGGRMGGMPEPATYGGMGDPYGGPPPGGGAAPPTEVARIDQLRRTFQLRRFGSGYDRNQVDRLFEGVMASLSGRGGQVNDGDLDPSRFDLVSGGYFEAEVDAALKEVRDIMLRRR